MGFCPHVFVSYALVSFYWRVLRVGEIYVQTLVAASMSRGLPPRFSFYTLPDCRVLPVADIWCSSQVAVRTINQLKNGIQSIFTRIGATSASVDEMLGNQGVTESNMMQYLGIIEQRTTEILQAYAASQIGLPNESGLQLPSVIPADGLGKVIPSSIPSYEDMSSGEDSDGEKDERPLTRQELEKRTMKEFNRKTGVLSQYE